MIGKKVLVTGAAGFIGFHLSLRLINEGYSVLGIDNLNNYYDIRLKISRLKVLGIEKESNKSIYTLESKKFKNFKFLKLDISNEKKLFNLFEINKFDLVCNLAAQAGVRYSIQNPNEYLKSNIKGFLNILEGCKKFKIKKIIYASSSSVYGNNSNIPFRESDYINKPISIYASSKISNEIMAHTYTHLYSIETIGLRFFTVYGPWGRPDMAYYLFTKAIVEDKSIDVFNNGNLERDFTYIDDIIEGLFSVIDKESKNKDKFKIYNIGNSRPVNVMKFIEIIEKNLGITAKKKMLNMQPGDVYRTFADTTKLKIDYGYSPNYSLSKGIKNFVKWYKSYYKIA